MSIITGIITVCVGGWLCTSGGVLDMALGVVLVLVGINAAATGADMQITRGKQ